MNYKKIRFWIGVLAIFLIVTLGIGFLVNSMKDKDETKTISLVGYLVIKDNNLHFDEVEIVESEDKERIKELGLKLQRDMPNGFAIINEKQEEKIYEFAKSVEFEFTDVEMNFIDQTESESDRVYNTIKKEEFLMHLNQYGLNDIPLFEQRIPYFIKLKNDKVISITEEFKYTI